MFKHWIWDFDGTLFDSYPRMTHSLLTALAEQNVKPDYDEAFGLMKISVGRAVRHYAALHGLDAEALAEGYKRAERESKDILLPYPGADSCCKAHWERGGRHYLYTHRNESAVEALRQQDLARYFRDAITSKDHFPSKPAPDALLHMMGKHELDPAECVMIGDRDIDIMAGRNAGMAGCLFDPAHFYDGYETGLRAYSMEELLAVLSG